MFTKVDSTRTLRVTYILQLCVKIAKIKISPHVFQFLNTYAKLEK